MAKSSQIWRTPAPPLHKQIRANRDQLFAEAVHRFEAGESWWEMPVEETRIQQANRYIPPAWVEPIQRYIENEPIVDDGETRWVQRPEPLKRMSIAEILEYALDLPEGQWTKANEMRVAESLRYLQWKKKRLTVDGDRSRWWIPRTTEDNPDEEAGPA